MSKTTKTIPNSARPTKKPLKIKATDPASDQQKSKGKKAQPNERRVSKHDQILTLLSRKTGASLAEIQKTTGWQSHSVRGFLSGTVKKRLRLKLSSVKSADGERRYVIVAV